MTIIAILLAFALCHFIRELGKCRNNQWLKSWINFSNDAFSRLPGWQDGLGFLLITGSPLLLLLLINQVLYATLGTTGTFLLATAVLIYTYGPTDLDTEVAGIIEAEDEETQQERLEKFLGTAIPEDQDACRALAVESVFREALRRWFSIIFWFAVLGITGAFLYRMVDWLVSEDYPLAEGQKSLFIRLQHIMDWPAAQLTTLSLAIATDFDSVYVAWKQYHDEQGHGLFDGNNGFLLASARSIVLTGHAARDGYADQLKGPFISLQQAMDLAWRVLGVCMTALALLLLIGVIT
ncbi:MAG: cobalamin biosynthesis protein [Xanthomonadales bacterium]